MILCTLVPCRLGTNNICHFDLYAKKLVLDPEFKTRANATSDIKRDLQGISWLANNHGLFRQLATGNFDPSLVLLTECTSFDSSLRG